jgi:creatinine amidohydrolase
LGVIEKHGEHLPLGTDLFTAHEIACRAAEVEPAIVFPEYYFTQIHEAKHQPGCIAIKAEMMWNMLENVCDEISRNGLKKIIFVNGHGGNNNFLPHFVHMMLEKQRDYMIYMHQGWSRHPDFEEKWNQLKETTEDGHAGEQETSVVMAIRPELVRMEDLPEDPGAALGRLAHLPGIGTPVGWYANYPDHYAGDGRRGTEEKGELLMESFVAKLVDVIRAVKADTETERLYREFFSRI